MTTMAQCIGRPLRIGMTAICVAMLGLSVPCLGAERHVASLDIDGPRPVERAVQELIERHGIHVSYEDPAYHYSGDIRDVTAEVARSPLAKGQRILVPAGSAFSIRYETVDGEPRNVQQLLQDVVAQHAVTDSGGRFRVEQIGTAFAIVPTATRDASGAWVPQQPVLETMLSLPPGERSYARFLQELCEAVSEQTGQEVLLGMFPTNLLINRRLKLSSVSGSARDLLSSTLDATGRKLSWLLLFNPGSKQYMLNIRLVPDSEAGVGRRRRNAAAN